MGLFRRDFRIRIGHGKNNRVRCHGFNHLGRKRAFGGKAKKYIGTAHRVFERAIFGFNSVGRFPLVHPLGTTAIDHTFGITQNHIFSRKPHGFNEL